LLPSYDDAYAKLRSKLARRLDRIEEDPYYSPELYDHLQGFYQRAGKADRALRVYSAAILEFWLRQTSVPFVPIEAAYWVGLLFRTIMLSNVYAGQTPGNVEFADYANGPSYPLDVESDLWGYEGKTRRFHIFDDTNYFGVDLPLDVDDLREFVGPPLYPPEPVTSRLSESTISRFVVPAMLWNRFPNTEKPLSWTFAGYSIGLS
jgi:hypothetical protein